MVAGSSLARKPHLALFVLLSSLWLAACEPMATGMGGPSINTRAAVPVALLVPASSPDNGAAIAQSLENAARLAIGDLQGAQIDLRVYDTGGQPQQAASAAIQAVQDGAKIIIGPVFAQSAAAAGRAVAPRGVNVLSFSNNSSVAGGNVFVLGNTFDNTANRLVRYAVSRGRGDILIAHGRDPSEEIGRDAILRAIQSSGASVAGVAGYELSQQGVINAIPQISQQVRTSGADAIFMTSGTSGAIPFLAELLPENRVNPAEVQFIGLQRLDIPESALTLTGLQGAWFAAPDPALSAQFSARYRAAYGAPPHPIAGLAYDAVAAIGALVSQGQADALTGRALTQPSGFAGVNGVFRLLPNGTNERALAVAQIQNNQVIVIDPAPRSFGGAGL
jgi:ABC-type branched-subunit amino acid transport system substrate-binding protein